MTIAFGIDRLLADPALRKPLEGKRVALLAHPASVTADLTHYHTGVGRDTRRRDDGQHRNKRACPPRGRVDPS